ncbi:MAG: hypothetical protein ACRDPE_23490 [Solirubrobacterales bacterium]
MDDTKANQLLDLLTEYASDYAALQNTRELTAEDIASDLATSLRRTVPAILAPLGVPQSQDFGTQN